MTPDENARDVMLDADAAKAMLDDLERDQYASPSHVLVQHYDRRSEREKMEQRRKHLDGI